MKYMLLHDYPFGFWPFWPAFITLIGLVMVLDIVLRGVALWRAARANQTLWFIAILIFNTLGILPLIYLLFFAPESPWSSRAAAVPTPKRSAPKKRPSTRSSRG